MAREPEHPIQTSDQDVEGTMGVSSERTGHAGPGQHGATGVRDTRETTPDAGPPEQQPGNPEENPEGLPPKAGYSSADPRDDDEV